MHFLGNNNSGTHYYINSVYKIFKQRTSLSMENSIGLSSRGSCSTSVASVLGV